MFLPSLLVYPLMSSASGIAFDAKIGSKSNLASVNPAAVGFSFDFGFEQWIQNVSNTLKCIGNFKDLSGKWPQVRLAGGMDDTGLFDPDLTVPRLVTPIQNIPDSFWYGPLFYEILAQYPGDIVFGLNRGLDNLSNAILAAEYATKMLPNLYALELGNEPDSMRELYPYTMTVYPRNHTQPYPIVTNNGGRDNWTLPVEVSTQSKWQRALGRALNMTEFIQGGGYQLPPEYGWTAKGFFDNLDLDARKFTKSFSHHHYPQSVSVLAVGFAKPDLKMLMSHANISAHIVPYAADTLVTRELGMKYVFGELNSVSGGGSPDISPTFGAGIWVLDHVLRSISNHIDGFNFHFQSYNTSYYVWWDKVSVRSPYYGGFVATEALSGGAYIKPLDDGTTNYAGYGIYDASKKLIKVVLINTDYYDGKGYRATKRFGVSGLLSGKIVTAKRLTAASALSRQDWGDAPTWAGQSFANHNCGMSGRERIESVRVKHGKATFSLAASEALLIQVHSE
ncbi:hypothetical protein BJX62DRAFT_236520 [Aspergillus germanicus]